jgi:hypothetical protein
MKALVLTKDKRIVTKNVTVFPNYVWIEDATKKSKPKSVFVRTRKQSPAYIFFQGLRESEGDTVDLSELYVQYESFCSKLGVEPNPEQFTQALSNAVSRSRRMYVENNTVYNADYEEVKHPNLIEKPQDIWFVRKRWKTHPVFVLIEGTNTTLALPDVQTFASNGKGELVTIDDSYMAEVVGDALNLGASVSTYEKLSKMESRSWYSLVFSAVSIVFLFMVLYFVWILVSKMGRII